MTVIISELLSQWPSLALFCMLGAAFWVLFRQHLVENRVLIDQSKTILSSASRQNSEIISKYKEICDYNSAELEKYRIIVQSVLKENEEIRCQYNDVKSNLQNIMLENSRLRVLLEATNEMLRATGSDVKVISKELERTRADIDSVSERIDALPDFTSKNIMLG